MSSRKVKPQINIYSNDGIFKIIDCKTADKEHAKDPRIFAHVFHKKKVMCVARDFWNLGIHNRAGIIWHETGHIFSEFIDEFDGADKEIMADYATEELFDVRIFYDYNKIQWVGEDEIDMIDFVDGKEDEFRIPII